MSDMVLWFALLGGEILLVLFVLLTVSWIRNRSARSRDTKAVNQLVSKVRADKSDREKTITAFLTGNMGLQGEALEKAKVKLMREEFRLLKSFAQIYRTRNASSAAQFYLDAEAALDAYHELQGVPGGVESGAAVEEGDGELEHLRRENARLSEELSVTMDTMSRMLSEYSVMFAPPADDAASEEPVPESSAEPAAVSPMPDEPETVADELDIVTNDIADEVEIASEAEPDEAIEAGRAVSELDAEELDISETADEAVLEVSENIDELPDDLNELLPEQEQEQEQEPALEPELEPVDAEALAAEPEELADDLLQEGSEESESPDSTAELAADELDIGEVPTQMDGDLDLGVDDLDALFDSDEEDDFGKVPEKDDSIAI